MKMSKVVGDPRDEQVMPASNLTQSKMVSFKITMSEYSKGSSHSNQLMQHQGRDLMMLRNQAADL
ncbi:hypothetical protein KFK09_011458 [Dendrobium nobile]|uniref:Uncharacterized protein n=1 Tax=Dendrobium nobile TaxID=94219 RepID=A0A8T3BI93_DENNO|nr:hypothetical protein KFK09_011458 [Dendrobium nobile]